MQKVWHKIGQFIDNQHGATAVEYGLIAALMAVASIVAFTQMGTGLFNLFGATNSGAGAVVHNAANSPGL